MATFTLVDCLVIVNGVTLSDHAFGLDVGGDYEEVEATPFGSTAKLLRKGLPTAQIEIKFYQDYAAGSVYATCLALFQTNTPFQVEVRPTSAGRGATNPGHVIAQALLFSFHPLSGDIGGMSVYTATFKNAGNAGMTFPTA
jgi:hypothetical protein